MAGRAIPTTGRCVVASHAGKPADLAVVEFVAPHTPRDGNVIVRVTRSTATYTDLLIIAGQYPGQAPFPLTPGYDFVGQVLSVGPGVTSPQVGDVVAGMEQHGGMTTVLELPASRVYPVPAGLDHSSAVAVVLTGVTAYQMLHRAADGRLATPSTAAILVHGCTGGTGAMLVALAKLMGVGTIVGTCAARNVDAATAAGVKAVDYAANGGDWTAGVRAAAPGGVDVVFDAVCERGYLARDASVLAPRGKVVAYGLTNSAAPGSIAVLSAMGVMAQLALRHSVWACFDGKDAQFYNVSERRKAHPADFAADMATLFGLVGSGLLNPRGDGGREWPLQDAPAALAAIAAGTHRGKQIIVCG